MGALGWSLPAGCSTLPYDDVSSGVSLLPHLKGVDLPEGVEDVVWDEDDNIIEGRRQEGNIDLEWVAVGTHGWNDDLSCVVNVALAARAYTDNNFWRGA